MKSNRQSRYAKHCVSVQKNHAGGTFSAGFESPTYFIFLVAPRRFFLLIREKEKAMNSTEIQGFT
jgi:hypothetical protein